MLELIHAWPIMIFCTVDNISLFIGNESTHIIGLVVTPDHCQHHTVPGVQCI